MQEPQETPKERHNRELIELLNELRVALPGVQVLFAFLLAVPFANGWHRVDHYEKVAFFVALLATAVSSALLLATPSLHRLRFREDDKEKIVIYGNRFAVAGFIALAVAMIAALLTVTTFLFDKGIGIATAVGFAVVVAGLWYVPALVADAKDAKRRRRAR
ncbi:MAG: hypothetical protein JOY72_06640 [Actinobacteria bacterium]|nr:hypothetical protein [Actinomycetota bacterium]